MKSTLNIINNFKNDGSSAICLDIRNSTQLVRKFNTFEKLKFHSDFLVDLKSNIFHKELSGSISINDTGDGFICLLWNKTHAWSAFTIAVAMHSYINLNNDRYIDFLKQHKISIKFGFGIGLHTASSLVYRFPEYHRDFMFGKVLNTTARLESFTKTFKNINFLMSGYFLNTLKKQTDDYNQKRNKTINFEIFKEKYIRLVTNDKVEINDSNRSGHSLYTINDNLLIINELQ